MRIQSIVYLEEIFLRFLCSRLISPLVLHFLYRFSSISASITSFDGSTRKARYVYTSWLNILDQWRFCARQPRIDALR